MTSRASVVSTFFFFMEIKREAGWVKGVVEPYNLLVKREMITSASKPKVIFHWTILAQMVKNLPATQETQVSRPRFLGLEDTLEKGMATHSSILAWRILWREELGRLQSMVLQRVRHDWVTNTHTHTHTHTHTPIQSVPEKTDMMS